MSHFSVFKGLTDLTEAEINFLNDHCFARNVEVNGHFLYMGRDSDSYSQTTFDFRGQRFKFYRHQLSLFLKLHADPTFDMNSWDSTLATSHLCGKKKCINPDHLHLEDLSINNERVNCFQQGRCVEHANGVVCII